MWVARSAAASSTKASPSTSSKALRKRVRKILTIGYFENYDVSKAGGRKILSWLVKRNYAFVLAIYISTIGAFEKFREGKKWAK